MQHYAIDRCTRNLTAIGKAIHAYHTEQSDFPHWLSELYPKYLPDMNLLRCPADSEGGKSAYPINEDPNLPVSYGYQFHPKYRAMKTEQRKVYGDAIPLVRCRHHEDQPFDCLNLSFSLRVYPSSGVYTPEELYETLDEAVLTLEAGLQGLPDDENVLDAYPALARLYIKVGRESDIEGLIKDFRSVIKPDDIRAHLYLSEMLELIDQNAELLAVLEKLESQYPSDYQVLKRLAQLHWKLGNPQDAKTYQFKSEPKPELIGKPVRDFSAVDLAGDPISLQDYRGKVVLLDFWAVWCGFCRLEMPNLKRVYDTYKDQGFDVIGVSLDDDETELRDYIEKKGISWRQIFDAATGGNSLVENYGIEGIPEPWLIDRDGTLISTDARDSLLEPMVVEALESER